MDAFAGSVGVSDSDGKATPVYLIYRPVGDADSRFYAYWLRSLASVGYILSLAKGIRERSSGFDHSVFSNLVLPVPPTEVQRGIADLLDRETSRVGSSIVALRRLRDLTIDRDRAVVDRLMSSCPDRVPLKRLVEFKEGPGIMAEDFRDEGVPLIRVGGLRGGRVTLEGCNYLAPEAVARRWGRFALAEGDYLLSASASMGRISRVSPEASGSIPYTGLIRLRPAGPAVDMRFARYFFRSTAFFEQVETLRTGVGIEHYGPTHLAVMKMPIASLTEQHAIADRLDATEERTRALVRTIDAEIGLLEERGQALLIAAVRGQIEVGSETR